MPNDNSVLSVVRALVVGTSNGERLPPIRELARRYGCSPVTVQHAITALEREGLVDPQPGRGTFVTRSAPAVAGDPSWQTATLGARPVPGEGLAELLAAVPDGVIPMASGYPDASLQSIGLLSAATTRAARRPGAWERSPAQGSDALRAWFATDLGGGVRADDVVVISGGQAALSTSFRSLASPGDHLAVESPTYVGALDAARLAGLLPAPVPTDAEGMLPDALDSVLRSTRAPLVYLQPHAANPTGAVMSAVRRADLLDVIRRHAAFAVEDDYLRDLHPEGRAPATMLSDDPDGHVVHVRSLTKSSAPSLRIAAVVARGPALRRIRNARLVDDFFVSSILQEIALLTVTSPGWPRHLKRLRNELSMRLDATVRAVEREEGLRLAVRPSAGLAVWVQLDDRLDDRQVVADAARRGVAVAPGSISFCSEPPGTFVRLSVAGADVTTIAEGVHRLGLAVRSR
jgi:DNA-binding transcriptional MocR family regulator